MNWKWTKTNNTGCHCTSVVPSLVNQISKITFLIEWTISTASSTIQILCKVASRYITWGRKVFLSSFCQLLSPPFHLCETSHPPPTWPLFLFPPAFPLGSERATFSPLPNSICLFCCLLFPHFNCLLSLSTCSPLRPHSHTQLQLLSLWNWSQCLIPISFKN